MSPKENLLCLSLKLPLKPMCRKMLLFKVKAISRALEVPPLDPWRHSSISQESLNSKRTVQMYTRRLFPSELIGGVTGWLDDGFSLVEGQ